MQNTRKWFSLLLCLILTLTSVSFAIADELIDGEYTGTGTGMHSDIQVKVTVADGKIANVEVLAQDETPGISDPAFAQMPQRIIDAQSADVDVVTTATYTSNGIIAAVKAALAGTPEEVEEEEFQPDFIIIGGGMAGMSGAIRATELGLKVLLLEGSARIGGSLLYAGGTLSGAGFKIQKENGVEDTAEAFYEDIIAIGGIENLNAPLAKAHAEKSAAAVDWMDEDIGADFGSRSLFGGWYAQFETLRVTLSLDDPNLGGGKGFLDPMLARIDAAVEDGSLKILLNTTATELVVEDGRCVGVKVGDKEYSAPTYLLATGGYSHNLELLQMAGFEDAVSAGPSTSNGSGYFMALAIGGVLDNMDNTYSYHGG
ncbi:MAG: FAD-binding protein, partial [Clostridia bacterium]|nr:FAD-binding protein [Clostridia bacterium]